MEINDNKENLEELTLTEQGDAPIGQNKNRIEDNTKQEDLLKEILTSLHNVEGKMKKMELMIKEQKPSKNWIG